DSTGSVRPVNSSHSTISRSSTGATVTAGADGATWVSGRPQPASRAIAAPKTTVGPLNRLIHLDNIFFLLLLAFCSPMVMTNGRTFSGQFAAVQVRIFLVREIAQRIRRPSPTSEVAGDFVGASA